MRQAEKVEEGEKEIESPRGPIRCSSEGPVTSDWISVLQSEALLLSTPPVESINTSPTHKHIHTQ